MNRTHLLIRPLYGVLSEYIERRRITCRCFIYFKMATTFSSVVVVVVVVVVRAALVGAHPMSRGFVAWHARHCGYSSQQKPADHVRAQLAAAAAAHP